MKLLLLTPQLPWPPQQGTAIRNFNLIEQLAARHTIDLLTFVAPDEQLEDTSPLHHLCRRVAAVPQPQRQIAARARDTLLTVLPDMALRLDSPAMREMVRACAKETPYDIVQAEGIEMARYGIQATADGRARLVFDNHNCEYVLQKRNALADLRRPGRWPAAAYSLVQWQKLRDYEARVCRRADATVAVSAADADALHDLVGGGKIHVVSNGIDLAYYTPVAAAGRRAAAVVQPSVVFTGKMDYRPNIDAALWFGREVWPRVLKMNRAARFWIVGRQPHPRLDALRADPSITITGAVEDVRPFIRDATACVIPLRVGGGTRFKALEAMACGRPIVSTALGVEGIGVRHGGEMLLADSPASFADAVLTLLEPGNSALRTHLGLAARAFVEAHYGWPPIVRRLDDLYDHLLGVENRDAQAGPGA